MNDIDKHHERNMKHIDNIKNIMEGIDYKLDQDTFNQVMKEMDKIDQCQPTFPTMDMKDYFK